MGRWISRDPIGEAGGVNLYEAEGNNAINAVDSIGLLEWEYLASSGCNVTRGGARDGFDDYGYKNYNPTWTEGSGFAFSHRCKTKDYFFSMCNTPTHLKIRVKNDSCCKGNLHKVECSYTYKGGVSVGIIMGYTTGADLHVSFIAGSPSQPTASTAVSLGVATKTIEERGKTVSSSSVNLPPGEFIEIFGISASLSGYGASGSVEIYENIVVQCSGGCASP